jgi:hypothetical protein
MNVTDMKDYTELTVRVRSRLKRDHPSFEGCFEDVQDAVWATLLELELMLKERGEI